MGKPCAPDVALLFVGMLYGQEEYLSISEDKLREAFGESVVESFPMPWDYSDYYRPELGSPLWRKFIFFRDMISPETLCSIKLITNRIEESLSIGGKRHINIDPGYLTLHSVVLASTKNYSHRIYMGRGIYAEVTLVYSNGKYRPHLFTYRDYSCDEYMELFVRARKFLEA